MFAYDYNQATPNLIHFYTYNSNSYPPASNCDPPPNPRRIRPVFDWRTNKANPVSVPPVLLELCTKEPWPRPAYMAPEQREWCARRLSARRRHLPLRSRPGAR